MTTESEYRLARSYNDWLVIELTQTKGVNCFRTENEWNAYKKFSERETLGEWLVLAIYNPSGVCVKRG